MDIASPQILIPVSPFSKDMIVAELGNIAISNEIVVRGTPEYEVYLSFLTFTWNTFTLTFFGNIISLNISNMSISSVRNKVTYPFLHEVQLQVSMQEPIGHIHIKNIPKQKVPPYP
jgi:hypothetical protein